MLADFLDVKSSDVKRYLASLFELVQQNKHQQIHKFINYFLNYALKAKIGRIATLTILERLVGGMC